MIGILSLECLGGQGTGPAEKNTVPAETKNSIAIDRSCSSNKQEDLLDSQIEDENFQLWQEAVNSMAKRKNKRSTRSDQVGDTQRAPPIETRTAARMEVEKAPSPPLIVPLDDEIKVVEISAASSPSQTSSQGWLQFP